MSASRTISPARVVPMRIRHVVGDELQERLGRLQCRRIFVPRIVSSTPCSRCGRASSAQTSPGRAATAPEMLTTIVAMVRAPARELPPPGAFHSRYSDDDQSAPPNPPRIRSRITGAGGWPCLPLPAPNHSPSTALDPQLCRPGKRCGNGFSSCCSTPSEPHDRFSPSPRKGSNADSCAMISDQ